MNKRETGSEYESAAAAFLERKGFRLLEKNFRCRTGEIDLIMQDGDTLVFVEVKFRSSRSMGFGEESVNLRKQQTIYKVAQFYLLKRQLGEPNCRFDVVAVDGNGEIRHLENAFEKH